MTSKDSWRSDISDRFCWAQCFLERIRFTQLPLSMESASVHLSAGQIVHSIVISVHHYCPSQIIRHCITSYLPNRRLACKGTDPGAWPKSYLYIKSTKTQWSNLFATRKAEKTLHISVRMLSHPNQKDHIASPQWYPLCWLALRPKEHSVYRASPPVAVLLHCQGHPSLFRRASSRPQAHDW